MPAAAYVAPVAGSGSTRVTVRPDRATIQAIPRPTIPAPMTTTSTRRSVMWCRPLEITFSVDRMDHDHARLYLCTDARKERGDFAEFLDAAFVGGVDIIQLRDKTIEAAEELELLEILRVSAERHGRLWAVNDRADIAALAG